MHLHRELARLDAITTGAVGRYICDIPAEDCEIDHIEPRAWGGPTTQANGRPACGFHNRLRNRRPGAGP